ncbi:MAG: hypothetical protein R3C05_03680 [Pirellulaceae bacterium]
MHAVLLADLAALIALHGPRMLKPKDAVPPAALQQYWIATRDRSSRWHSIMGKYHQYDRNGDTLGMRAWWEEHLSTMEEILVSEILTRVYAGLGHGLDAGAFEPEIGPVVHSVHLTHLEARNRVLGIMIAGRGASTEVTARLNQLRKTVERWTDVLVGQIAVSYPEASRYGTVLERTLTFADDSAEYSPQLRQTHGWFLSAAMRDSLSRQMSPHPAFPEENSRVCDAVLVCLRPDMFESLGTLQSLWLHRLRSGAEQADCVLKQLLTGNIADSPLLDDFEAVRGSEFHRKLRR